MTTLTASLSDSRLEKESRLRHICRNNFTAYKHLIFKRYEQRYYLDVLDWHLMQVAQFVETKGRKGIQNLMISMPRRYGKTLTLGRLFPSWYLGRNPDHRLMLVSYNSDLAEKTSRQARNILLSPRYQALFGYTLAQGSKSVKAWDIAEHEGGMDALGVLGGATGKGWHILLADDLFKNREEAESETMRKKTWDELQDSFFSGSEESYAARIVNGTRWHPDDAHGRLLLRQPERWVYLKLPALALEDDILGRAVGEALHSGKHTREQLLQIEQDVGPYSWSSLWQQDPTPGEGGFFQRRWFDPVVHTPPDIQFRVRYWDLAFSDKATADYTVGVLMGLGGDGHYYVLDVVRRQVDFGQLVDFMAEVMLADGPSVPQGIEETFMQTRVINDLNADHRLHGYGVMGYPVDKKKHIRALPVQAKLSSGLLHVIRAHWTDHYIDEFVSFTPKEHSNVHDDQVDATSGAWAMMDGQALMYGYRSDST